jgi:hypothetical protein
LVVGVVRTVAFDGVGVLDVDLTEGDFLDAPAKLLVNF